MFNKVIMIGNLVRDPELRFTAKGSGVCSFSIALNRKFKKKDSDTYEEEVCFICFGIRSDFLEFSAVFEDNSNIDW